MINLLLRNVKMHLWEIFPNKSFERLHELFKVTYSCTFYEYNYNKKNFRSDYPILKLFSLLNPVLVDTVFGQWLHLLAFKQLWSKSTRLLHLVKIREHCLLLKNPQHGITQTAHQGMLGWAPSGWDWQSDRWFPQTIKFSCWVKWRAYNQI